MSGTERGLLDDVRFAIYERLPTDAPGDHRHIARVLADAVIRVIGDYQRPALAAALAEHEGCAGCARVEALAAARESRAEAAALRTEREEAVRLLRIWRNEHFYISVADAKATDAFLARTDTPEAR